MSVCPATLYEVICTKSYDVDEDGTYQYYDDLDYNVLTKIDDLKEIDGVADMEDPTVSNATIFNLLINDGFISPTEIVTKKIYLKWDKYKLECMIYDWGHKPLYKLVIG